MPNLQPSPIYRPSTPGLTDHAIILDLDETLVHTYEPIDQVVEPDVFDDTSLKDLHPRMYQLSLDDSPDYLIRGIMRPYLKEFLNFCFFYFRVVVVWSAGQSKYVHAVVDTIFRDLESPQVIYTHDHCEPNLHEPKYLSKPIAKMMASEPHLNLSPQHTFILDDRLYTFNPVNPHSGILIPHYDPELTAEGFRQNDQAFPQLVNWLLKPNVMISNDIRSLDKSMIFSSPEFYDRFGILNSFKFNPNKMYEDELSNYFDTALTFRTPPRSPIRIPTYGQLCKVRGYYNETS